MVTICAGFLQIWASRFSLSPDAVNYLDMANAVSHGDWKNAVNAYWSPLFSWLLALGLGLRPNPYWESTILHLVNFIGLLVALLSFEFFFRSFLRTRKQFGITCGQMEPLSDLGWWILGYGLFVSTSLLVLSATLTTPDVWVSVFTYLVAGLVVRIRAGGGSWRLFAVLGFTLGCAYLTKAFYFPMGFIFLAVACLAAGNVRQTVKQLALGLVTFFLVAGPWIAILSSAKHRLTFGDVGKMAYAATVDRIPQALLWQGENGTGIPKHPVRELLGKPRLFEFASPIGGTYPPAFGWSYWMEGVQPRFSVRGQLSVFRQSVGTFFLIFLVQIEYGVALVILLFLSLSKSNWITFLRTQWYIWAPPLVACLAYALVLVEQRYVAPFVLLLWVAAFSGLFATASELPRRVAIAIVLAVLSVTGLRVAKSMETDLVAISSKQENVDWEVSRALRALGIQPGDRVSILSAVDEVQWARLAGVTVVSEIPLGEETVFWTADPETKRKIFQVLAGTGAKVVVTRAAPPSAIDEGWFALDKSGFYAHPLPAQSPAQ